MLTILTLALALLLAADTPGPGASAEAIEAVDLSRLTPHSPLVGRPGRFVFVPDSLPGEDADGRVGVDAAGASGCSRCVLFAPGETDDGLDTGAPVVVEGVLVVNRFPGWGPFKDVVELQVRDARRVPAGR